MKPLPGTRWAPSNATGALSPERAPMGGSRAPMIDRHLVGPGPMDNWRQVADAAPALAE